MGGGRFPTIVICDEDEIESLGTQSLLGTNKKTMGKHEGKKKRKEPFNVEIWRT